MALAITDEHRQLADAATAFLSRHGSLATARESLDTSNKSLPPFWEAMAELGWMGLHLPDSYGGSGYGIAELCVVLEATGHGLVPGPFLPTVLASAILCDHGTDELRQKLLPGLADGSVVAGFGSGGTWVVDHQGLEGRSEGVLTPGFADVLLLLSHEDVLVVDADADGLAVEILPGLDPTRQIGRVTAREVPMSAVTVLPGAASAARTRLRTLASAEALGSTLACVEMSKRYALERVQFGRPIGTFQAVKHHLANMLLDAELTVAATWDAARITDPDRAGLAAAVAATYARRAQIFCARTNIQLHGGIGFTWDHDAHLYLRRAESLQSFVAECGSAARAVAEGYRADPTPRLTLDLPPEAQEYRTAARKARDQWQSLPEDRQRAFLVDSGYLVPHWKKPWGLAADPVQQLVIEEAFRTTPVPDLSITGWIALTISESGTPDQQRRWVKSVLLGETQWCQLFSEPGAGSDAAAIRTSAVRVEGGWRVTGQKIWTSLAHESDWGIATVRTDPRAPKHTGITMMAVDLAAEGVDVRPIRELTGQAGFNEVFLDDVFVPDSDVLGEVGAGWKVARATFGNERVSIGAGAGSVPLAATDLLAMAANEDLREVGELLAEGHALRLLNVRQASRAVQGVDPGPEAALSKLVKAEHSQKITDLGMRLGGLAATTGELPVVEESYLFARCLTIAGGSSEVMRNHIAERILGLPRDPILT
ncbi:MULTISPECIES: acyl-CoA dehydrogenase [unclassified Rhodococcus (in: high G+C Gram-positive bacteria)]|uniref:acyl-CoA dehydrogenase n=1 Tax=unclassified Rhodococcus (in: high G+C Gram-positive bacteria) TaxID=192944 RepID=UPI0002F57ED4|nr:acyl-CoA dehydrogenase [Rhodococcus sp. DK17]